MDFFKPTQTIQSKSRPTPELSAYHCCGSWLEDCPWPVNPQDALNSLYKIAEVEEKQSRGFGKFQETIESRVQHLQNLLQKISLSSQPQFFPVAPNLGNVVKPSIRYFRALVWNLENFTHDKRPAGTLPIHSRRNQARIAIAADFAFRMGTDTLLILETGNDVGQAMTQLAKRWSDKEQNSGDDLKRSVEPLVSPATHGLSEIPLIVKSRQYDAEPDILRSLMLLGEGYSVRPAALPDMSEGALGNALDLLVKTSNNFQKFDERPPKTGRLIDSLVEWAKWCLDMVKKHGFGLADQEDLKLLWNTLVEAIQNPEQFLSQPDTELGKVREAILAARDVAAYYGSPTLEAGVAEIIQMLLMAWILNQKAGTLDPRPTMKSPYTQHQMFSSQPLPDILLPSQVTIWLNDFGEPADLVALALYLGAGQQLVLSAHDQDNGAIFTASDGELLLNSLIRLGILPEPHAETYGVVYRPYTDNHLQAFFEAPFEELGFKTKGLYGIVHGNNKNLLVSQQPGNILAGRSALKISFPVTPELWVPFAIHHNRFSGSKEISVMDKNYAKSENAVLARLMTLEDEARFLAGQNHPPLIVGDFNLPSGFLQPETGRKSTTAAGGRRAELRKKHVHEMGCAGYVRRQRKDFTNPETTLKRALNIAKGVECFSEPYDAVYQPFDFLGGQVIVRSAAVRSCDAFFPEALLNETIVAADKLNQPETVTIKTVLVDKIQFTYMGIVWCIIGTMNDAEPWLSKNKGKIGKAADFIIDKRQEFGEWLKTRKFIFQKLLENNFYGACDVKLSGNWLQDMDNAINLVSPFVKEFVKNEKKAKAQAKKDSKGKSKSKNVNKSSKSKSDMIIDTEMDDEQYDLEVEEEDDEQEEQSSASTPTKKVRPKRPGEQRLIELGVLFKALINLEKRSDLRLWGAYTGIVSDHLPILVEVELPK